MRGLEGPLRKRELDQRNERLWSVLAGRCGEVTDALWDLLGRRRRLEFALKVPGYGARLEATMVFVEHWAEGHAGWSVERYVYDYHVEPRPSGRRAHHWHALYEWGATFHSHCENPAASRPHYRGVPVTLLEAAEDFVRIHARGSIDCEDLLPLGPA